jgi:hypothetical protein
MKTLYEIEIEAMRHVAVALEGLDAAARRRVLQWAIDALLPAAVAQEAKR